MKNRNHILYFLVLFLLPYHTAAQGLDQFKPNTGDFTPSTIIIIIIGIIFMLTGFLAVFLKQFSDGCFGLSVVPANANVDADGQPLTRGLDAEAIKSIPTYFYSDVKMHRQVKVELECAVCLGEFQDTDALRLLPVCSHVFHPRCIDRWLSSHVTCPICRQSLEAGYGAQKPCAIINIPMSQLDDEPNSPDNHGKGQESSDRQSDPHIDDHENEQKGMKMIVGKFPRSHSTGHSLADSERFTLRLPEEVQNSLTKRCSYAADDGLTSMLSPRIASKSRNLRPIKTSDLLWPI